MKNKSIRYSFFTILTAFSVIPLMLSIAVITMVSFYITKNILEQEAKDTLYVVANNLASHCHENEITVISVTSYYDYIDSLQEKNIEMAIILDGGSCTASIKNENDYRIREIEIKDEIAAKDINGYYDDSVEIDGKVYYGYFMPIEVKGNIIGVAFAGELQDNVTGATKRIILSFAGVAVLLIIVFTAIALIFGKRISRAFEEVGKNVNALSKGILSRQVKKNSIVKEMHELLNATMIMQENLSGTIGKVKSISDNLVETIEKVTVSSESSSGRAKQITASMEELSLSAMSMSENVQNINLQMLEIGNCVNDISGNVDYLANSSENILLANNEAKINLDIIMENGQKSVESVKDISRQIRETNDSIVEIDKAVELILSISEQTNLLSLNASIEAARAGELGRGFAVVAEEIRHLSEQSAEGAEMIKNVSEAIVRKSKSSVQLSERVHSLILHEQQSISYTRKKYEQLSEDINRSVKEIQLIAEKTEKLTEYKEKIIENVQSLSAISEENAANNEEVSSNILEIISEVQTVNENCEKMNNLAEELNVSVSYFHN